MTTESPEAPKGERLARIEAMLELLVRQNDNIREDLRVASRNITGDSQVSISDIREEMREMRKEARAYFFWTLGILVGIIAPLTIGLLATVILRG